MDIRTLSPRVSVSAQMSIDELSEVAAQGYGRIICNRPDNEEPEQPDTDLLAKEARRLGLEFHAVPISGTHFPETAIDAFAQILDGADKPVLAYCRSGSRSAHLWALSNAATTPPKDLIESAGAAGYDLQAIRPVLEGKWQAAKV